ncbi:MAG: hypothetical protein C4315_06355 [Chloroflexota bacterium]
MVPAPCGLVRTVASALAGGVVGGLLADRFGHKPVLAVASLLIALILAQLPGAVAAGLPIAWDGVRPSSSFWRGAPRPAPALP